MNDLVATYAASAPTLDSGFADPEWSRAESVSIGYFWHGEPAPETLKTTARILWTESEIIFGYECLYENLDMDETFDIAIERYALWDRDVCEAFVRSPSEPAMTSYKEFEVAPTAQWCDLKIDRAQMTKDWEWQSQMRTGAKIDRERRMWCASMALPFTCFGDHPSEGGEWFGNIFRAARRGDERMYLAYSPNSGDRPNFHVPEAFVKIHFAR